MTDVQIKHMVDRFLGWRLPYPWHPDNGISYQRPDYAHPPADHDWPTGTNLFDADQAEAMVRYMVEEMPGDEVEFGWVIERGDSTPATPTYWAGSEYWSQDHMDAVRFARKQDAERVACRLHGGYHRVCEHGWHKLPEQGMLVRFNHEPTPEARGQESRAPSMTSPDDPVREGVDMSEDTLERMRLVIAGVDMCPEREAGCEDCDKEHGCRTVARAVIAATPSPNEALTREVERRREAEAEIGRLRRLLLQFAEEAHRAVMIGAEAIDRSEGAPFDRQGGSPNG